MHAKLMQVGHEAVAGGDKSGIGCGQSLDDVADYYFGLRLRNPSTTRSASAFCPSFNMAAA